MSNKGVSLTKPTAMLLGMSIYVQSPGIECEVYVEHPDPHKFCIIPPTGKLARAQWLKFCAVLGRSPWENLCVHAVDWLEADVKIRDMLEIPSAFVVAPPVFNYVYSARADATFKNTPGYTIQEIAGAKRAVSIEADEFFNPAEALSIAERMRKAGREAFWSSKSAHIEVHLTPKEWHARNRLTTFASLIALVAST
jgi:hypothetical protein